jgi:hypothetical protein
MIPRYNNQIKENVIMCPKPCQEIRSQWKYDSGQETFTKGVKFEVLLEVWVMMEYLQMSIADSKEEGIVAAVARTWGLVGSSNNNLSRF